MSAPLHSPVPGLADLGDAIAAYALGGRAALDPAEARALEAHLAACPECRAELAELGRAVAGIGLNAAAEAPPPSLREKVLAAARADERARGGGAALSTPRLGAPRSGSAVVPWMVAAASLAIVGAAGFYAMMARQQATDALASQAAADTRVAALEHQLDALSARIAVLTAVDAVQVKLAGQPDAPTATASVVMSPTKGMVLNAQHLPALAAGKIYQLWVVTKQAPVSIGVFDVDADGSVTGTMPLTADAILNPVAVAVTIEPSGGVPSPTGPKVLVGAVSPQ